jgi:hypothetical protein
VPRVARLCSVLLLVASCKAGPGTSRTDTSATQSTHVAAPSDSLIYSSEWNIGDVPEEPENSVKTRFRFRVEQFRSGKLALFLDSAPALSTAARNFSNADSVRMDGLTRIDRFTPGCDIRSEEWAPRVAIVADSVYERKSRPRFIWLLDTANARIKPLPTDSALCFIAGPD